MNHKLPRLEKQQRSGIQLFWRLACLGIMGEEVRAPPTSTVIQGGSRFKGGLLLGPQSTEMRQSLGQLYV